MSDAKEEPATNLPKVLRIGIIQNQKIVEERRLKKRETVTVGTAETCTFPVKSAKVPKSVELFEYANGTYYLRYGEGIAGKVQYSQDAEAAAQDFATLEKQGRAVKRPGGGMAIELSDSTRGKVEIGDINILFQFVEPPAAAGKVALPAEIRGGFLSNIDVQFTSIFVATSIVVLAFVSYAQGLPYVEPSTIEEVSERYQKLIMPDRVPEPPREAAKEEGADKAKEKAKDEQKDKKDESKAKAKAKDEGKAKEPVDAEAAARAKKEALAKQVAGKGLLGVIGSKGRADGALSDVFSEGEFGEGALGDAFSGIQGVDIADSGGKGTRGGGAGGSASIGDIATEGGGSVSTGGKGETAVVGTIREEAPEVEGDLSQDVIVKEMRKNMRALKDCYERQLKRFPTLSGKISVSFEITDSGRIGQTDIVEDTMKNADVKQCILSRARSWRFPKPSGGSVFVTFPFVFSPAG
jgi:hypothetical protein